MLIATLKSLPGEDICLQISLPNRRWSYLCDCGYASQLTIKDCKNTEGIFISHTHLDHFSHFDTVFRHQLPVPRKVVISGPKGIAHHLQHKLLAYNWEALTVEDEAVFYEVREIVREGEINIYELNAPLWHLNFLREYKSLEIYENEAISVKYRVLNHKIDCIAYVFEEKPKIRLSEASPYPPGSWVSELKKAYKQKNKDAFIEIGQKKIRAETLFPYLSFEGGDKIAYVMDHLPSPENHQKIIELCQGADSLFIEAYFKHCELDLALHHHHSTAKLSGQVARLAQAKQLFPVHFSRRYKGAEIEEIIAECLESFKNAGEE
jgi:ribonuclease Z